MLYFNKLKYKLCFTYYPSVTGDTVLSSFTTSAWGRVRKFATHHAQAMEEDRIWVAEAWVGSYCNGKDRMQDAK